MSNRNDEALCGYDEYGYEHENEYEYEYDSDSTDSDMTTESEHEKEPETLFYLRQFTLLRSSRVLAAEMVPVVRAPTAVLAASAIHDDYGTSDAECMYEIVEQSFGKNTKKTFRYSVKKGHWRLILTPFQSDSKTFRK